MRIAIIGTGNVGGALARTLSSAGHDVIVSSTIPEEAEALAREVGGSSASSSSEAVQAAEVIVLAVPYDAVEPIISEVGKALDGKILVDVTNRMSADDPGTVVDGTSNAEQIQSRAPNARVVKAFNTVLATRQADPEVNDITIDGYVAASDQAAKDAVLEIVRSAGMRPIDAGPLEGARILEAMGALLIFLNMQGGSWKNAWKLLEPTDD